MRDPKILANTVATLAQAGTGLIESSESAEKPPSFGQLEVDIFQALMAIGALLLAGLCGSRNGYQGKSVPRHRDVGTGRHRLEYKGSKKRWVMSGLTCATVARSRELRLPSRTAPLKFRGLDLATGGSGDEVPRQVWLLTSKELRGWAGVSRGEGKT